MAGTDRGRMTRPSHEEGITDLPDPQRGPAAPTNAGGPPPNIWLYGSLLVVGLAVLIGLQNAPGPRPVASPRPSRVAPTPMPTATAPNNPLAPPSQAVPSPAQVDAAQHLVLGGTAGLFISDHWITVDLPPGTEGDYYAGAALDTQGPVGITIQALPQGRPAMGCLATSTASVEPSAASAPPVGEVPSVGAASGSAFSLDGLSGHYYEFVGRSAAQACHPNLVWDAIVGSRVGARGLKVRLQLWVVDTPETPLVVATYAGLDLPSSSHEVIRNIVASIRIDQDASVAIEPAAEPFSPGWYSRGFLSLWIPRSGWTSSGAGDDATGWELSRGTVGAPDGAVLRIGHIDGIYTDPCAHERETPSDELADAITRIPGIAIVERARTQIGWYDSAEHLVLTTPRSLPCEPHDFYLWWSDSGGPRAANAAGSIIRIWIFTPCGRAGFGRWVVEAETYPGFDPAIESEFLQMVNSITHGC
jgi:hypothetical protein